MRHRPSTRALIVAATVAALVVPGVAEAAPGKGKPRQPSPTWYGGSSPTPNCQAGMDRCVLEGSADLATRAVRARADLLRTTPAAGHDGGAEVAYVGKRMTLDRDAHTVTATVHFSGVSISDVSAGSTDGQAFATSYVGAELLDSGCAVHGCGSEGYRVDVVTARDAAVAGADLGDTGNEGDASPDQTLTVTLSMPDGSLLPRGTLTAAAFVAVRGDLVPVACGGFTVTPQTCTDGPAHTGHARATTSAVVSSIDVVIS